MTQNKNGYVKIRLSNCVMTHNLWDKWSHLCYFGWNSLWYGGVEYFLNNDLLVHTYNIAYIHIHTWQLNNLWYYKFEHNIFWIRFAMMKRKINPWRPSKFNQICSRRQSTSIRRALSFHFISMGSILLIQYESYCIGHSRTGSVAQTNWRSTNRSWFMIQVQSGTVRCSQVMHFAR